MANPEAFTTEKFFSMNGGLSHLKHALRDRFDKNRIPEPNIRISVFQNGEMQEAKKEDLYGAYNYNLEHKQRKNSVLYFEEMVSDYDLNKTQEIAAYLSEQFEGRPVYVIQHFDESHLIRTSLFSTKIWSTTKHHESRKRNSGRSGMTYLKLQGNTEPCLVQGNKNMWGFRKIQKRKKSFWNKKERRQKNCKVF